jgi:ABC-type sugar transport system permease subunit
LAGDAHLRLAWSAGVGMLIGGLFTGLLVFTAPAGKEGYGLLLGLAMAASCVVIGVFWKDLAAVKVTLEDTRIHRKTTPLVFNPLGFLSNRHEYWPYEEITRCGYASAESLGRS